MGDASSLSIILNRMNQTLRISQKFSLDYQLLLLPGEEAICFSCSTYFKILCSKLLIYSLRIYKIFFFQFDAFLINQIAGFYLNRVYTVLGSKPKFSLAFL